MNNTTVYRKGSHYLEVVDIGKDSQIVGLRGWLDSIEVMALLLGNGYKIIR